jgi:hypothetical protein
MKVSLGSLMPRGEVALGEIEVWGRGMVTEQAERMDSKHCF